MRLLKFWRKDEEPEMIEWRDGYHRSIEPMQRPTPKPLISQTTKRNATRIGVAAVLGLGLHFSGVTDSIIDSATKSPYAPAHSAEPTPRP